HNAAFVLYDRPEGNEIFKNYYLDYINLALNYKLNFILESATWRCNPDWGYKLGYSNDEVVDLNIKAINHLCELRTEYETSETAMLISGNIGPRGDGYVAERLMSLLEAASYHSTQIKAFKSAGADMVSAFTINYSDEGAGIVLAAKDLAMPVVISFTVETDGKLNSGESLTEAIGVIENASNGYPLYYMINCAHPQHFKHDLMTMPSFKERIKGIRANSSIKSHAELDNTTSLDSGDRNLLSTEYKNIKQQLPSFSVIGGCCGTDHTHIEHICKLLF
ncbi:MAG: homocysteine S-methyltransferase family protein, partial [Pyrinomonadaceae bacterium]|nr:homocysteine S-methyltransferase family protein [Sphingobacteriaceae bacterium]